MAETELMRTSLYAGGTSPVKIIQAGFYNEDCLVYDLEDSVSAGERMPRGFWSATPSSISGPRTSTL